MTKLIVIGMRHLQCLALTVDYYDYSARMIMIA